VEIRLFRDDDRDGLISLLRTVFDGWHADPPSHWNWLYERNPAGTSSIGVAVEDGDIVASYRQRRRRHRHLGGKSANHRPLAHHAGHASHPS